VKIPFADLKAQYHSIKDEIDTAIKNVIQDTAFIKGKYVKKFEKDYAKAYGTKHCIGVSNGTDALYVVQKALGIGPGDEVITVANTWISTAETIFQTGAEAIFVDIEPDFYNIDVNKIIEKINERTKAIIPVHLYGQPANMESIVKICKERGLYLIEDTAQAHFSTYGGKNAGTFGDAGTFSFFPAKNMGAYGDAGGIITNDDVLAQKMRIFANHGAPNRHDHEVEGIVSRMDGLQAAILSVKLNHIKKWNKKRLQNALYYNDKLSDVIFTPKIRENVNHVFHQYVVRVEEREKLREYLKEKGISTGIHYPTPLPFLKVYKNLGLNHNDFPISHDYQSKILSLPIYPELSKKQLDYVCNSIIEFYSN
jgi:dTDP-4-amino-4,6-dideoxygalactose transaminase